MNSRDRVALRQARQRIRSLVNQVDLLESRLSAAVDKQILLLNKLIDAEATIARLRAGEPTR
ncbi:hypothetical protein D3C81_1420230 [compost metagenome]